VIVPSKCRSTSVDVNGETYVALSESPLYIKLYYGLCDDQSATDGGHCTAWDDESSWKQLDLMNKVVFGLNTNFEGDALYAWPTAFRVGIACLILVFAVMDFIVYAIVVGSVSWGFQMGLVFLQCILIVLIWLHLVVGLLTDMILPTSWKTYQLGCDIYTGPGAAWWAAVIGAVICIYSSVLLLFPYLMGPLWVNHMTRQTPSAVVTPSFELDLAEYEGEDGEEELDEEDPYRGIKFEN
jgi:hypothetical protein